MNHQMLWPVSVVCILLLLAGCKREEVNGSGFRGTWVEERSAADTITVRSETFFTLSREKEMTAEGYWLPGYGSGAYGFKISKDEITLNNSLSSCYCPKAYPFKLEGDRFTIGNFYAYPARQAPVLVFRKIR